ncbi:MAG: methyltransferase domain-containing protein [Actinomycetaceae bacterium]|nr:methyltransferase domain-containing protein [Actinomycetaceae bacterium]
MSEQAHGARQGPEEKRLQGHWLLAKMGKRVLRPGGIELTRRVIANAKPSAQDRIVEFGPGVGRTAEILLAAAPRQYIGVDPNTEGTPQLQAVLKDHPQARLHAADARSTGLPDACADLVVGEAMLTMQSNDDKLDIMKEAFRILAPSGRYAIHELGFHPDDVPDEVVADVSRALSRTIKVGARPLTSRDWQRLLREAGFEIEYADTNPMALLEPKRLIADEGLGGALRFFWNVRRNRAARERIMSMRSVFRQHADHINAVGLVARKPAA